MKKLKILIVEDQPTVAMLLKKIILDMFGDNEYQIFLARDSVDGWEVFQKAKPDLVLSDWSMPNMDGLELCKLIKKSMFSYFVMVTSATENEELVRAFEAGADDFIKKPFSKEEVYARVLSATRIIKLMKVNEDEKNKLAILNKELEKLSKTDMLTKMPNKKYFMERAEEEWAKAKRKKTILSLVMIDVDYFKKINDTFGHLFGDIFLEKLANLIRASIRREDVVCRFGGEEFVLIVPDTHYNSLSVVLERIQNSLKELNLVNLIMDELKIKGVCVENVSPWEATLSFGGSSLLPTDKSFLDVLLRADKNLYEAKGNGRNNFVLK